MISLPHLTVKERALIHLYLERAPDWGMEYPESLTQKGIANVVDVSRAHISQTLIPLVDDGLVSCRKSKVTGAKRRRNTYMLTDLGRKSSKAIYERLMESELRVTEGDKDEILTLSEICQRTGQNPLSIYLEANEEIRFEDDENEEIRFEDDDWSDSILEVSTNEKEQSHSLWGLMKIFILLVTSVVLWVIAVTHNTPFLCFFSMIFMLGFIVLYKSYIFDKRYEGVEGSTIIQTSFRYWTAVVLLISYPPLLFVSVYYLDSFPLCFSSFFIFFLGVSFSAYYTSSRQSVKSIEQVLSTIILADLIILIYILSNFFHIGYSPTDEIYLFLFVLSSVVVAFFVMLRQKSPYTEHIPFVTGAIFFVYGFLSYIFPDVAMSSMIPLYWVPASIFLIDSGFRWCAHERWLDDMLLGVSVFIIAFFVLLMKEMAVGIMTALVISLWLILFSIFVATRFIGSEKRSLVYHNLWNGLPVSLAMFLGFVAILLFMSSRYLEGLIESLLAFLFIIEVNRRGWDRKPSFLSGVLLGLLLIYTLVHIVYF